MRRASVLLAILPLLLFAPTASAATCVTLTHTLVLDTHDSAVGGDVTKLQQFLVNDSTVTAKPPVDGYYGITTEVAVAQWQSVHGIVSSGTPATTGYGTVGAKTRAAMSCGTQTSHTDVWTEGIGNYISPFPQFMEFDIGEYFPANGGWLNAVRDWRSVVGTQDFSDNSGNYHVSLPAGTFGPNNFNRVGFGYVTAPNAGGTGSVKWYLNNQLMNQVTYSDTGQSSSASPNVNGVYSRADTDPQALIMGAGTPPSYNSTPTPIWIRSVRIWCKDPSCMQIKSPNGITNPSPSPSATPTNGTCGSSNGTTVSSAPTTNLCSVGTASSVSGSGPFNWTCNGSNGGTNASCSASLQQQQTVSNKFSVGNRVQATASLNIRGTATIAGVLLGTESASALGTIIGGPATADGFNWWNVNYDDGKNGWSVEDYLTQANTPAPSGTPSSQAQAFLNAATGLSQSDINTYTALINGLVADGLYQKLDALYAFGLAPNRQTALINLVNPGTYNATEVNGPNYFSPYWGFISTYDDDWHPGSGQSYIDTNFNPATAVNPHFTQNSAHISEWTVFAYSTHRDPTPVMSAANGRLSLYPQYTTTETPGGNTFVTINDASDGSTYGTPAIASNLPSLVGLMVGNRSDANSRQAYFNGVSLGTYPSTPSVAVPNSNITVLGEHIDGGTTYQVAFATIGGSLTQTDETNLYNLLKTALASNPPLKFSIGDRVQANIALSGTNGSNLDQVDGYPSVWAPKVGTQPLGAQGSVISGPIVAQGTKFWNINFDTGTSGWVYENNLTKVGGTQAVNGVCGSSNGTTVSSAPTTNLCSVGTASSVSGSGPFNWTCNGSNGGTNASCSASLQQQQTVSNKFSVGNRVQATASLNIRGTATIAGVLLGTESASALGTIIGGPATADGFNWWNVNYDDGKSGWSVEDYLAQASASTPPPATSAPSGISDDEFVGPFASWQDLKRDYGAKGDGVTDDTQAIQNALNSLSTSAGKSPVLYIPAGIYIISSTVTVTAANGISIIGADPGTVTLKWIGAQRGIMFHINGVGYSKFDRITFDGSGTAGVVVDQSVTDFNGGKIFDTGNEYADDVIENGAIGLRGGAYDLGASEVSVLRDKFLNNTTAAIAIKNFNALDWWIWYSDFENNTTGITNVADGTGAGNFNAYNNVFKNSKGADLELLNTGNFNFRDNFSIGSSNFLYEHFFYTNAAPTRMQGNTIIAPSVRPDGNTQYIGNSVSMGNMGPMLMTDNTFVSPSNANSPAVSVYGQYWPDCIFVGNTFTQSSGSPTSCLGNDPVSGSWDSSTYQLNLDNKTVDASTMSQTPPTLPGVLPNNHRQVFDVSAKTGAAIQTAINQAAQLCGQRPVVHMPYGSYAISQTITVPSNCDIQLMGDGDQTALGWSGSGSMLVLQGPSRAILRDFDVYAGSGTGIEIQNADQQGARIYGEDVGADRATQDNILVDGLDYATVELDDAEISSTLTPPASTGIALNVIGGPQAQAGNPQGGKTEVLAASGGNNYVTFEASKGASLIARDFWYEAGNPKAYAIVSDNSMATFEGSRMAVPMNGDSIEVNNESGNVAVLLNAPDAPVHITGSGGGTVFAFANNFSQAQAWWNNQATNGSNLFNFNRRADPTNGSVPITDANAMPSAAVLRTMLTQSRNTHPANITSLAPGITDVRLYRVGIQLGSIGLHIER